MRLDITSRYRVRGIGKVLTGAAAHRIHADDCVGAGKNRRHAGTRNQHGFGLAGVYSRAAHVTTIRRLPISTLEMNNIDTAAVRAEPHVEIGTLLQRRAHAIVDRWCALARDEQRAARCAHHVVLRDELPEFLELVGGALKRSGAGTAPQKAATAHGTQRWDSGWSLSELVRDYQLLRLVILDFLEENLGRAILYREAMAVGVLIDDAIAASIARYVAHREEALKRSESERAALLEAESRRKDEFLAILGHELRNPLAPIRNSLTLMRKVIDSTHPAITTSLDVLDRQSRQLERLVDDMLDIARISRGEFDLRKELVDLRSAIEQALQMTAELIVQSGHKLHVSIPDVPLHLQVDAQRITQIVCNLLNNAAKYTDRGGNVWLAVAAEGENALIRVRDDGIGIPPAMLSHVFELFARVDGSPSSGREGLGIGLALVQRLVQSHGGTISAHSEGLGKGAEFVVRLPIATNAARSAQSSADRLVITPLSIVKP